VNRKYSTDFEIRGPKSQDPENAVVDIYVAVQWNAGNKVQNI
jgi:hypothetical protein